MSAAIDVVDRVIQPWWGVATLLLILASLFGAWPLLLEAQRKLSYTVAPVVRNWTVTSVEVEGGNAILRGQASKHRECEYLSPPVARIVDGNELFLDNLSPTAGTTRPADGKMWNWGPWVVHGGACKRIELYYRHLCDGRQVSTYAGEVRVPCPPQEGPQ